MSGPLPEVGAAPAGEAAAPAAPERRVLTAVLPGLAVELATAAWRVAHSALPEPPSGPPPLAVVLTGSPGGGGAPPPEPTRPRAGSAPRGECPDRDEGASAVLHAVSAEAARLGVRPGQTVAEATALAAHLVVRHLSHAALQGALAQVAEVALGLGTAAAVEAPDTVWLEVTGVAHLFGGEAELGAELGSRVRALGHAVRVVVAAGPRLGQAVARWGVTSGSVRVVPAAASAEALAPLPVAALPLPAEVASWLVRLGVLTVGELAALPREAAASRLGPGDAAGGGLRNEASRWLDLAAGVDGEPLHPLAPPSVLTEALSWEEPVEGVTPLVFALRGLTARLSARLAARGLAATTLTVRILGDAPLARWQGVAPHTELEVPLAAPLWREEELFRVLRVRVEGLANPGGAEPGGAEPRARERTRAWSPVPALGIELSAPSLTSATAQQLELGRVWGGTTGQRGLEALPVVLAELEAELGRGRVGVLQVVDAHRAEAQSRLVRVGSTGEARGARRRARAAGQGPGAGERAAGAIAGAPVGSAAPGGVGGAPGAPGAAGGAAPGLRGLSALQGARHPTRLLPHPLPLTGALRQGNTLALGRGVYTIEQLHFEQRLEAVEWWSGAGTSRDVLRLWLQGAEGGFEAWVYVDRVTGARYLQGVG